MTPTLLSRLEAVRAVKTVAHEDPGSMFYDMTMRYGQHDNYMEWRIYDHRGTNHRTCMEEDVPEEMAGRLRSFFLLVEIVNTI